MAALEALINAPEFTVTELSSALRRTVEDAYGHVRVRGEISGFRGPHSSGHCYFALKDGEDWRNLLDVGQKQNLEDSIRANILRCYGVVAVNSLAVIFYPQTRFISITALVQTIYSPSFQLTLSQIAGVTPNGQ